MLLFLLSGIEYAVKIEHNSIASTETVRRAINTYTHTHHIANDTQKSKQLLWKAQLIANKTEQELQPQRKQLKDEQTSENQSNWFVFLFKIETNDD